MSGLVSPRGIELKCDRCNGGGVDMGPRPIDAFPVTCFHCKGYGGMIAREISERCGISEGVARKILRGTWRPRTLAQLDRVMDLIMHSANMFPVFVDGPLRPPCEFSGCIECSWRGWVVMNGDEVQACDCMVGLSDEDAQRVYLADMRRYGMKPKYKMRREG